MIHISVVIPVYNRATLICETLASVEAQTLCPSEVVIVDDGSTDNSVEIVRAYKEKSRLNIQLYENGGKKGQSGALNYGIAKAQGGYIAMQDSDDLWTPNHLRQLADALEKFPTYDFAFSKIEVFGTAKDVNEKNENFANSVARCLREAFDNREGNIWLSNKKLLGSLLEGGVPFRCPASLIRKPFFKRSHLQFDETITYCLDAQFMTQAAYHAGFLYVDSVGFRLRRHAENDGDVGYGDKVWQSYEKRAAGLKEYFSGRKLTGFEKNSLSHLLKELFVWAIVTKTRKYGVLNLLKGTVGLFKLVPSLSTVLLIIKLYVKFCLGILHN